ncbi:DUF5937 family protein [Dactylosporangium sp. CA-139066]|uniref:DUF5937 family protein n=1 Tax=Dactylosporangium sp. CA-139066 TaxID=3239930 RepID=UPI003D89C241
MLRYLVDSADLLHSRFALSPSFELENLLRVLDGVDRHHSRPAPAIARYRPAFDELRRDDPALRALLALHHPRGGAGFVAPPPTRGTLQTIDDDLVAIRAVPLNVARGEIAVSLAARPTHDPAARAVLADPDVTHVLADGLRRAWDALLAADWLHLRAICERDIVYRSGLLARQGWAAAIEGLHARVHWRDGGIEVTRMADNTITVGGEGMMFIPSVFIWPGLAAHTDDPWSRAIIYPARGIADWWAAVPAPPSAALEELIGRTRARVLVALRDPASTTQLARSLGIPTGSAGDHLRALRRAGLLDAGRSGRSVLYHRTPLGDLLVGA